MSLINVCINGDIEECEKIAVEYDRLTYKNCQQYYEAFNAAISCTLQFSMVIKAIAMSEC